MYYLQFFTGKLIISILEFIISLFVRHEIFVDKKNFSWTELLEKNADLIREEYLNVVKKDALIDATIFSKEQLKSVEPNLWSVYPFRVYGKTVEANCIECPVTASCLDAIPNCTTAWFSAMKPGTYVKPHRGTYKGYLRCLLGLIVPETITESGLVINDKHYHWETNECVIFDDTFTHSAYNNSNITRVVLYIDFIRPMPKFLISISKALTYVFSKSKYVKNMKFN